MSYNRMSPQDMVQFLNKLAESQDESTAARLIEVAAFLHVLNIVVDNWAKGGITK